jgi:hypothetical protein
MAPTRISDAQADAPGRGQDDEHDDPWAEPAAAMSLSIRTVSVAPRNPPVNAPHGVYGSTSSLASSRAPSVALTMTMDGSVMVLPVPLLLPQLERDPRTSVVTGDIDALNPYQVWVEAATVGARDASSSAHANLS